MSMLKLFILSVPIIILHLFVCKGISFKLCLRINESSFRVRVIYDFLYFCLNRNEVKLILLCHMFISFHAK
jgi:hypothetical protein